METVQYSFWQRSRRTPPSKSLVHVIWDNAAYHRCAAVKKWLSRPKCRIHLIQLPTYCPHLNPIERLWAVLHAHVTHNRFYPTQKQFANAILHFLRNTIPKKWTDFQSQVSENFRITSHQNFQVLEWGKYRKIKINFQSRIIIALWTRYRPCKSRRQRL